MKKIKISAIFGSLILAGSLATADVHFTGMAGGTTGISGVTGPAPSFALPFNAFAAAQLNFNSWGIFRANFGLSTSNLATGELFTGQDAKIILNELSLVLSKTSGSVKHYFNFYFGTYEAVGKDEFMQRQFGILPVSSLLTKSATTLSCGVPLYENNGGGFSYTCNFSEIPGTIGFALYLNMSDPASLKLNFDLRTAWTAKLITIDFAAGIGIPLTTNPSSFLAIDTFYLHAGASILLGNLYTHSLFIQAGVQNFTITAGTPIVPFNPAKDLSFIVEPRITTKYVKTRITAYNLTKDAVKDLFYLEDPLGASITVYSDAIPIKNNNMTAGVHLTASFSNHDIVSLFSDFSNDFMSLTDFNAFFTPFVTIPFANGEFEAMAQFGMLDILHERHIRYQAKVGYKKSF